MDWKSRSKIALLLLLPIFSCVSGCTSLSEWLHNGLKVGPNYHKPPAPVAPEWVGTNYGNESTAYWLRDWNKAWKKEGELRKEFTKSNPKKFKVWEEAIGLAPPMITGLNADSPDLHEWWKVFNDPILDELVETAYRQNLDVRTAGTRILAARALRNIAAGNLFPQLQEAFGDYARVNASKNVANPPPVPYFDNWATGFNLTWEIDFWGRFRRAVEAADAELDASVENYDDVLVLLFSDIASTYVEIRTFQERIRYAEANIARQQSLADITVRRFLGNLSPISEPGLQGSNLADTRALLQDLKIGLRLANNRLCVLLGIPPRDLIQEKLGDGAIPRLPPRLVAAGAPAELLRRRPDIRRAERNVAAQSARIGIATANLYPRFSLIGTIGYEAANLSNLISSNSVAGNVGPNFRWDILNYGRLLNGIRLQDALFQREVLNYQNTVLQAGREAEDAMVGLVRFQLQADELRVGAKLANVSLKATLDRLRLKWLPSNSNEVFLLSSQLRNQQDKEALARGNAALSLIQLYKALGGGWEIRLTDAGACPPGAVPHGPMPLNMAPQQQQELLPAPELLPSLQQLQWLGLTRPRSVAPQADLGDPQPLQQVTSYHAPHAGNIRR